MNDQENSPKADRGQREARARERDESSPPDGDSAPTPGSCLQIQLLHSIDSLSHIRDEWDSFVEQSGSDIYFTVDWLVSWWKHYGQRRTFLGIMVSDGSQLVGALPFCVQQMWAGPIPVRLAKFVGADSTLPVFTPAIANGFEDRVIRLALESLLENAGCDAVSLSPLSGLSRAVDAAERVGTAHPFKLVRSDSPGVHTVFRFPASFDEYLRGLSYAQRQNHRRYLRKLKGQYRITFRTVSGHEAVQYFDRFAELHAKYWQQRGKLGHFGDWPAGAKFNRDLIASMSETGRVRFYEVAGDGGVFAIEYCFVLGDRCYWRLPARDPDPELDKLRIGRVSLAEMFRMLIETGQQLVEGGPGQYEYKRRLGAEEHPLRRIIISTHARRGRWRTALLAHWTDVLQYVYYRGWYLKLRPKLGFRPRALRQLYIRSQI